MPDIRIRLLGGFAASVEAEPVAESAWRLRKGRELVKLLALAPGNRLHREQLIDALWPELGASAGANNLNQAVHAARRALGAEAIQARDGLLELHAAVDVELFEQAAVSARASPKAAGYRAALALYGGELLPENRYDDFASGRREELTGLRDGLERELAALGSTPGPRGLPADASSFVGRSRELGELRSLLARTRLLTLSGTGGAGKTRLALELARGVEDGYADGAAFVELAGVARHEHVEDARRRRPRYPATAGAADPPGARRVRRRAPTAPRARQLRARARLVYRRRRCAPAGGAEAHRDRHDPGTAPSPG